MSNTKKVSIILPVYNAEAYLHKAIDSVLGQTYENLELIISDNCSTDRTYEICSEYASKDKRIRLSKNERNIGPGLNFNKCIELCTGEYIELFGHDDWFEPTCIEKLATVLDTNSNVVAVTSARNWVDGDGQIFQVNRHYEGSRLLSGEEAIRSNIEKMENWISAPVMYRSNLRGRGFNINIILYADLDYWCQMFKHGDFYYLDEVLFNYRIHDGSGTSSMMRDLIFAIDLLRMTDRYGEFFGGENAAPKDIQERLGKKLVDWAQYIIAQREYGFDHLMVQTPVDLSVWPLPESERFKADAHDYRRAVCVSLYAAVLERLEIAEERKQMAEVQKNFESSRETDAAVQARLHEEINRLSAELETLKSSTSWRITAPLRKTMCLVRR